MTVSTLADDLIAARAQIDTPEKWRKHAGNDGPGTPCCLVVATVRVRPVDTAEWAAMCEALQNALPNGPSEPRSSALGWFNDIERTTHADVVALFDRAIATALSSEQPR